MRKRSLFLGALILAALIACPTPAPLSANFTWAPAVPAVGQNVQFTDTSTGSPTAFAWKIGGQLWTTVRNPSCIFNAPGVIEVSLAVEDAAGAVNAVTRTVTVVPALVASFSHTPTGSLEAGWTVALKDTSVGGPTSWAWDFGDGATSTAQNPTHQWAAAGSFNVKLTVTNAYGSNSSTQAFAILAGLKADFTWTPTNPMAGGTVQFTDKSVGLGIVSWLWDFGDGTATSALQNPTHVFTAAGSYVVTLTVTDSYGVTDSITLPRITP